MDYGELVTSPVMLIWRAYFSDFNCLLALKPTALPSRFSRRFVRKIIDSHLRRGGGGAKGTKMSISRRFKLSDGLVFRFKEHKTRR
jgi:hypothetical protein